MFNRNHILAGIILGIITPILGYFLIDAIFKLLNELGIMDPDGFSFTWRERTTSLLAICMNLIPFQLYKLKRFDNAMRGLIFPTIIMVAYWVYHFRHAFFLD